MAGRYEYAFRKIASLTYRNEREEGDRNLVERATARERQSAKDRQVAPSKDAAGFFSAR
jgi:hypothetical protein